jgi:hypothetical protein
VFADRRHDIGPQPHVNRLNKCWERRIGHRLQLSLHMVDKASTLSESERAIPPGVTMGEDGVGNLITRFVTLHSDWSSGSRDPSVALHWSFLHSLSRRVADHCRRLTSAFRAGSLVTCHCLRGPFKLNACRYRSPWVVTWTTFGKRCCQSLQVGT